MPQGRIVLKRICQSRKLAALKTDGARLLYTWLIPNVDSNGCFSGDAEAIKGQIFTRLNKSRKVIESYLLDLEETKLIVRYTANGDIYLQIPDFIEKQPHINANREAKTTIPLPTPDLLQTNSGVNPPKGKSKGQSQIESKSEGKIAPTLQNCKDTGIILSIPEQHSIIWYEHYAAQGFFFSSGVPMSNLRMAMQRHKNNGTLAALVEKASKIKTPEQKTKSEELERKKEIAKTREQYQEWLEAKTIPALLDLKKDKGMKHNCGWLINEILTKRKQ